MAYNLPLKHLITSHRKIQNRKSTLEAIPFNSYRYESNNTEYEGGDNFIAKLKVIKYIV